MGAIVKFSPGFRRRRAAPFSAIAGACVLLSACGGDGLPLAQMVEVQSCCKSCIGCAMEHNLAMLVDKPSDLAIPRKEGPRDSTRREAMLSAYRGAGQPSEGGRAPQQGEARP